MASRRRGCLWLAAGLIFALLAALVAMAAVELRVQQRTSGAETAQQAQATEEPVAVVVVARTHISANRLITEPEISLQEIPAAVIPEGAATTLEDVVGRIATSDIFSGEIVLTMRLAVPDVAGESVAFTMPKDRVIFALPPDDLMSQIHLLKPGTRVDILFSLQPKQESTPQAGSEGQAQALGQDLFTVDVLQSKTITAIVLSAPEEPLRQPSVAPTGIAQPTPVGEPVAILLALTPQDALILKYFRDAGGIMDIVIRHPENEELFDVQPVNLDYVRDVYAVPVATPAPGQ